jgi:hypothetical protein
MKSTGACEVAINSGKVIFALALLPGVERE